MRVTSGFVCSLLPLQLVVMSSSANVHVVRPDGSGDYPTIQAAVNAATSGDIVELTDGTFTGPGNRAISIVHDHLLLRSQSGDPASCTIDCQSVDRGINVASTAFGTRLEGVTLAHGRVTFGWGGGLLDQSPDGVTATDCVFYQNTASDGGGGVATGAPSVLSRCRFIENSAYFGGGLETGWFGGSTGPVIDNCAFIGNTAVSGGGAIGLEAFQPAPPATIRSCTFVGNSSDGSPVVAIMSQDPIFENCTFAQNHSNYAVIGALGNSPVFHNCIITLSESQLAISCGGGQPTLSCSDVVGGPGGGWVGCIAEQAGQNGNLSADPQFCDPPAGDFRLQDDSPCAPSHNPGCGLIGALPVGCDGPVPVIDAHWGSIKWLFR